VGLLDEPFGALDGQGARRAPRVAAPSFRRAPASPRGSSLTTKKLGILDGDHVLLDLRDAKVFVQDYVI
jgi:hypothetical protein